MYPLLRLDHITAGMAALEEGNRVNKLIKYIKGMKIDMEIKVEKRRHKEG